MEGRMSQLATIPEPPQDIADELASVEMLRAADERMDLADWYVLKMVELDDLEERIKEQAKILRNAAETRRKALAWKYGPEFKRIIDDRLATQKGAKKSVTLFTGRAGYRMAKGKVVQHDRKALAAWCVDNCPDALEVTVARTTPIVDAIQKTGEIPPGVDWIPGGDVFYPRTTQAALPQEESDE
jgi:hypothetical protein